MTTSTRETPLQADLKLRPNPFSEEFWVEGTLQESGLYRLRLLNAQGQIVWEDTRYLDVNFQQQINAKNLPTGIYLFRMERNGAGLVRKILKD